MYYGLRLHSTELILFASRTAFAINAHLWASSFHHFLTFLWRSLTIELFMVVAMLMFIEAPTIIEAYCWLLQNPCPLSISWSRALPQSVYIYKSVSMSIEIKYWSTGYIRSPIDLDSMLDAYGHSLFHVAFSK